jgi:hypothetical protein
MAWLRPSDRHVGLKADLHYNRQCCVNYEHPAGWAERFCETQHQMTVGLHFIQPNLPG